MKKTTILILFIAALALISCGDESSTADQNSAGLAAVDGDASSHVDKSQTAENQENIAICLWTKVGLRSAPGRGKDAEYLTTIYFGEKVELTGDEKEDSDRNYLRVKLSDGSEGWADEALFSEGGSLAVATSSLPLYKRPDLATMQGKNFEKGELLIVKAAENGWQEAVGFEKRREGWIQANTQISDKQEDILVCMLYQRAISTDNADDKKKQLETIMSNSALTGSDFIYLVSDALSGMGESEVVEEIPSVEVKDNELFIIANKLNVRTSPTIDVENVTFQMEKGQVATIIQKAASREQVNGMEDYWYKIEYKGQQGWVFGFHTSKRIGL